MWAWTEAHAGGQTRGCRRRDKGRRQLGAWDVKLMSKAAHVYVHACVHRHVVWSLGKEGGDRRGKAVE